MSAVQIVLERMRSYGERIAVHWQGQEFTYHNILESIDAWDGRLSALEIRRGTVCGVVGEFSPATCALFFALMRAGAIIVPLTKSVQHELCRYLQIAGVEVLIEFDADDGYKSSVISHSGGSQLISDFRALGSPGLVVFTSGSTGVPKGILHDCDRVVRKFVKERSGWRSVLFLLMDHFGGFNTFLAAFAYGGTAVCLTDRAPSAVCETIQKSRATLLPATPTFLNLLIASGAFRLFDLSSIKLITYGTEVMPEATLHKVRRIFPNAEVKQTYGLSELGVLRSKSQSDTSLWVKVGGDGFEVKVVDGVLWVRSEANMVGYLNAPSPIDPDGWMCTGDHVEVNGEYMRILGRKSEMINVGGQKVFPAEVETVLLEAENVKDVTAFAVSHQLMGNVVHAQVSLIREEDHSKVTERLRAHCVTRLARYKIPVKFHFVVGDVQHTDRFKKLRVGMKPGGDT